MTPVLLDPPVTLLDPHTGRPEEPSEELIAARAKIAELRGQLGPIVREENHGRGWRSEIAGPDLGSLDSATQDMLAMRYGDDGPFAARSEESIYREMERLPPEIKQQLAQNKTWRERGTQPPIADHSMYEVLRYWIIADTSITAAAETIMVPAFGFGGSEMAVGTCLKYTLIGSQSFAITTPGTAIMRMRWAGVAGALQATSATLAPTGTQATTTASFTLEYWMIVRSIGAAGTLWCQGRWEIPGSLETTPASTTILVTYMKATQVPASAAAVGAAIDFTAANGPTPTYQSSVSTANCTTHLALLECMN